MTGSIALIYVEGGDGDVDDQKSRQGPDDHNHTYDHYLHNDNDPSPYSINFLIGVIMVIIKMFTIFIIAFILQCCSYLEMCSLLGTVGLD